MDENYRERFIPPNFENGINILGLSFQAIYLIEGGLLGIAAFLGFFFLFKNAFQMSDFGQIVGFSLVFAAILAFLGIRGINDEPLSTFLVNLIQFAKNKRTAYYNPRVKKEAVSYTEERESSDTAQEAIPRERILALIEDIKEKHPGKTFVDDSIFNPDSMQFADDKALEEKLRQEEKEREKIEKGKKK